MHCGGPGARCEYHYCGKKANWSTWMPSWTRGSGGKPGYFKFFCHDCLAYYQHAMLTPMKGIDRPADADEDWKGSILDHIRHARIAMTFNERNGADVADREREKQRQFIREEFEEFRKRAGGAA